MKNHDHVSVEGIIHGPFPTPDVAENKVGSQWLMNWADNDPKLYQLLMQREAIYDDYVDSKNTDLINPNLNRIAEDIVARRGILEIAKLREEKPPTNKIRSK